MQIKRILSTVALLFLFSGISSAQIITSSGGGPTTGGGGTSITGGTCTNQAMTAINVSGVPTCTTLTSAYVNNSIALTGVDINTANQVTVTHLASPLPVAQGGIGAGTVTGILQGNGTGAVTGIAIPADNTKYLNGVGAFAAPVVGGTCTNQTATAISVNGVPTCTTITSAYTNNSIAATGADINTSNQVTLTHLASALPTTQGGTGLTAGGTNKNVLKSDGTNWSSSSPVDGGTCTNQTATAISVYGVPTCTTITSAYVNTSIAQTGVDVNTSHQVVATHLTAPLPAAQGGCGTAGSLTGIVKANGSSPCTVAVTADLPTTIVATVVTGSGAISGFGGIYEVNSAGTSTLTLDSVASNAGKTLIFYNVGAGSFILDPAGAETICDTAGCTSTKTYGAGVGVTLVVDSTGAKFVAVNDKTTGTSTVIPKQPGLRLTTESNVCLSTADRTAQGTIYFTPCESSYVAIYSGSAWIEFTQAQLSLALTVTSGKNYDVFIAYNSGTPNLALSAAWTNDTTRADALALQNGMTVKSADHTLLWIGTIRASGSNTTEDSGGITGTTQVGGKRFVWNNFNRKTRSLSVIDTTDTWTYATNTWRSMDGAAGNKVEWVTGDVGTAVTATTLALLSVANTSTRASMVGVGIDSTSSPSGQRAMIGMGGVTWIGSATAQYVGTPGLGYHFATPLEKGGDGSSSDWFGDNAGTGAQAGLVVMLEN